MPRSSSLPLLKRCVHEYHLDIAHRRKQSLPQRQTSEDIATQIRESLGLPPKPKKHPTVPVEGHVCEFPLWSYSKMQCPRTFDMDLDTLICKSLDTDFVLPLVWAVHFA
jgi:hypothetical protein